MALGHRKRTGKDTIAKFLVTEIRTRHPGISVKKVGFADKVKDVGHQIFGWAGLQPGWFYDDLANEHLREVVIPRLGKTPRQLWIGIGNGIRHACGFDDCWFQYALEQYKCDVLIFKDLRFHAEAEGIEAKGGYLYRVDCSWASIATDGADNVLSDFTRWRRIFLNDERDNFNKLYSYALEILKEVLP